MTSIVEPGRSEDLHEIRSERNLLIPTGDGATLAADLRVPDDAGPFPTLLGYYPYRKDDLLGASYAFRSAYFAQRGYAVVLIDLRGLGSSSGRAMEPMASIEQMDCLAAIDWAVSQDWCDGNIGFWGMSYGAITALKAAAARPPHLRAIVPIMGSFDIYRDWFYPGGCANCLGTNGSWGSLMLALQLAPPMYQDSGGRWWQVWQERLSTSAPYLLSWRGRPDYDDYWQAKVTDVASIEVPTFLIGGWRDVLAEAMVRAYGEITAPRKLLMGPWLHSLPDIARTDPVDYLPMVRRWWDHWLKDEDNGIMEEPPVTFFVQGTRKWRHAESWPPSEQERRTLFLGRDGALGDQSPAAEESVFYRADPTVGHTAGLPDASLPVGLPLEQTPDDLRSITFTTVPLAAPLEIAGSPEAVVYAAVDDGADANLVVKLCDVAPSGASTLITTGWLKTNSHRPSEQLDGNAPGAARCFRVGLCPTAYGLPAGHRLRVSISCSDFPRIWPTATNPSVVLSAGGTRRSGIRFVTLSPDQQATEIPAPDPYVDRAPAVDNYVPRWRVIHDLANEAVTVEAGSTLAARTPDSDGRFVIRHDAAASVRRERPDCARVEGQTRIDFVTPGGNVGTVETQTWLTAAQLVIRGSVEFDGSVIFEQVWRE